MRFVDRAAVEMHTPKLNENTIARWSLKRNAKILKQQSSCSFNATPFHRRHKASNAATITWQDKHPSHVGLKNPQTKTYRNYGSIHALSSSRDKVHVCGNVHTKIKDKFRWLKRNLEMLTQLLSCFFHIRSIADTKPRTRAKANDKMNTSRMFALTTIKPKLTETMAHVLSWSRASCTSAEMRMPKSKKNTKCIMIAQKQQSAAQCVCTQIPTSTLACVTLYDHKYIHAHFHIYISSEQGDQHDRRSNAVAFLCFECDFYL